MINIVEPRHDLVLDDVIKCLGFKIIAPFPTVRTFGRRDLPAVRRIEPLVPPAVANRQIRCPVNRRLHPRSPARFVRTQRIVHPDIAARVEPLGHGYVVIGKENDVFPDLGIIGKLHHLLDQGLTALVCWVRLACDDDLNPPLLVSQQRLEPCRIAQHQGQPLIGRHPPREAEGNDVGVKGFGDPVRRHASIGAAGRQPLPRHGNEVFAHPPFERPDGLAVHTGQRVPVVAVALRWTAARRLEQLEQIAMHPGQMVDAVGDLSDRHLAGVERSPQSPEHLSRHHTVQRRHPVGSLGKSEAHHGHIELVGITAFVIFGAQGQDAVDLQIVEA